MYVCIDKDRLIDLSRQVQKIFYNRETNRAKFSAIQ